jgi:hypothetical protein
VVILGAGASRAACPNGDAEGRVLPVMDDMIEVVNLQPLLKNHGISEAGGNFETIYDDVVQTGNYQLAIDLEKQVHDYFSQLRLPAGATIYDYLLLSLRPKDLIATFNWDPLLVQAFKRHEGKIALPQLAFLHGNVAYGYCEKDRRCGWVDDNCNKCGQTFTPSPLLYPIREKDYNKNPFIYSQWELLESHLEHAYFMTIFGYSAPTTDSAARDAMMKAWRRNESREIAQINLLDIKTTEELQESWHDFITRSDYGTNNSFMRSYLARHPRRSCDALFAATMMLVPWRDDWLPEIDSYSELRDWVDPLWREEHALRKTGEPFSGRTCNELRSTD